MSRGTPGARAPLRLRLVLTAFGLATLGVGAWLVVGEVEGPPPPAPARVAEPAAAAARPAEPAADNRALLALRRELEAQGEELQRLRADLERLRAGQAAAGAGAAGGPDGGAAGSTGGPAADAGGADPAEAPPAYAGGDPPPLEETPFARARFEAAVDRDAARFPEDERRSIEDLYRDGMAEVATPQGRALLEDLISRWPESNRAGCAALNLAAELARAGDPAGALRPLDFVVGADHPAVFRNGVRVLPQALELRGRLRAATGDADGARADWTRLAADFADETDARGRAFGRVAASHLAELPAP